MATFISKPKTKRIGISIIPPPMPKKPDIIPMKIPIKISVIVIQAPLITMKV
jgi:hypothetical protein